MRLLVRRLRFLDESALLVIVAEEALDAVQFECNNGEPAFVSEAEPLCPAEDCKRIFEDRLLLLIILADLIGCHQKRAEQRIHLRERLTSGRRHLHIVVAQQEDNGVIEENVTV